MENFTKICIGLVLLTILLSGCSVNQSQRPGVVTEDKVTQAAIEQKMNEVKNSSYSANKTLFLSEQDIDSLGLKLWHMPQGEESISYTHQQNSDGSIHDSALFSIQPTDNGDAYQPNYVVNIDIVKFTSASKLNEYYLQHHDFDYVNNQWNKTIEENFVGESYLYEGLNEKEYYLVFMAKNYLVTIGADNGIGVDKVKGMGKIISDKISANG